MTRGRLRAILSYWRRQRHKSATSEMAYTHISEFAEIIEPHLVDKPLSSPDMTRTPLISLGQGDYKRDIPAE